MSSAAPIKFYNLHRQILSQKDLDDFISSPSYTKIFSFLNELNESVKGKPRELGESNEGSQLIGWLLKFIISAEELIDSFPPQNRNADVNRFGNVAFRDWLFRVQEQLVPEWWKLGIEEMNLDLGGTEEGLEIQGYLINSFGSSQRIDYGTGHELHFLIFLLGLKASPTDHAALVLKVFSGYLRLMRKLQKTYWLEPAGSHGVWGLDDYHFLPFLFGSAQLWDHENIRPRAVHSSEIVHYLAPKYIYFESILNILQIKASSSNDDLDGVDVDVDVDGIINGPKTRSSLRWMSPVLDDISAVKTWNKVNSGLIKMWSVEVMSKLPIMQHLLFGDYILNFKRSEVPSDPGLDINPVHYTHSLRGDCCGNPLPSIYASSAGTRNGNEIKTTKQPGLPFD